MAIVRYGTSIIHTRVEHVVGIVVNGVELPPMYVPAPADISDADLEALVMLMTGLSQEVTDAPADEE